MLDAITAPRRVASRRTSVGRFRHSLFFHQTLFLGMTLLVWEVLGAYVFDPFWSSRPSLIAERLVYLAQRGDLTWQRLV